MQVLNLLNQIAFAVLDLRRTEAWWREGLVFGAAHRVGAD